MIVGLHHAQVTIPLGAEDAARAFYCGTLGLREIPKPARLAVRGGFWLEIGAVQVHVGTEDGIARERTRAHLAFEVDDLAAMRTLVAGAGLSVLEGEPIPGLARFETRDPFGNRMEFVQRLKGTS
jgi:catechol 2,3-dioxygenase-like lactoylglutathione lyase family enzyme